LQLKQKSKKSIQFLLKQKDIAMELEIIENKIQSTLNSLSEDLKLKSPKKNSIDKTLQKKMTQLELENTLLKTKDISKGLKEDLRIKAQNLLIDAEKEVNMTKKEMMLEEATKIIGKVFLN
jgi:hypothetical protein